MFGGATGLFLEILAEELLAARAGVPAAPLPAAPPAVIQHSPATLAQQDQVSATAPPSAAAATVSSAAAHPAHAPATSPQPTRHQLDSSTRPDHLGDLFSPTSLLGTTAGTPDLRPALVQRDSFLSHPTSARLPTSEPNSEASSIGPASSDSDETSTEEEGDGDEAEEEGGADPEAGQDVGLMATPRRPRLPARPEATPLRSALKRSRGTGGGHGVEESRGPALEGRSVSFSLLE